MKTCNYPKGIKSGLLASLIIVGLFFITGSACAHEVEYEHYSQKSRVEVTLNGVNDFGVIRIFDYLLHQVPGVSDVRQTQQWIRPNRERTSQVVWRIIIRGGDAFYIERELHRLMRDVHPMELEAIYEDGYDLPNRRDFRALKQIKPVYAVETALHYMKRAPEKNHRHEMDYEREQPRTIRPHHRIDTVPYVRGSGMGFE